LSELIVALGSDPLKRGWSSWRHATITYEKIRLEKSSFWIERDDQEEECLQLLLKHARLQNMTYPSKLKLEVSIHVYITEKSDKAKANEDSYICRKVLSDDKKEIIIGSLPVMMKSKQC